MIPFKLVRHPAPYPTESLPGYVLRLSELNGYPSPRSLYRMAEMKAGECSPSNFNCPKFGERYVKPKFYMLARGSACLCSH